MTLEDKYIIARWAYAIGIYFISDIEYDHIEEKIKEMGVLSDYTSRGWSEDPCPYELLKQYDLDDYITPIIYSHQTESIESLNSIEKVKQYLSDINTPTRLSYKLDGFNLRINYYNGKFVSAQTRNRNGGVAKDLTNLGKSMFLQSIPIMGKVLVIGELYLNNKTFEDYKQYRGIISQRSAVSTAIAKNDFEYLGYKCYSIYSSIEEDVKGDKYKVLSKLGFPTPKNIIVNNYESVLKGVDILGRTVKSYPAPTDGIVLENESMQYALRIGAWKEECNKSYVTGYTINRGIYNNNLLVKVRPVFVNSKTISEIDVDNIQNIIDNNLRIGSPIAFVERSSVNSVLDTTKTEELQNEWEDRYDEYKKYIEEVYK